MKHYISQQKTTALLSSFCLAEEENVREIAAIDLGSNSFHMIVARIVNGSVQVLSRLKQKVQLAAGLDENGVLNQEAIDRGVACLALFAERLQNFPLENVTVVGTYTLRSAVNNEAFLQQAKKVFPYPINIISGETEAKLIYAGVSHTQPEQGRKLIIDIGGGSTEMIIGDDFTPILANSRNMGCVSFAGQFFPQGKISQQAFEQAYQTTLQRITDLAEPYKKQGWQSVLGSSGTIKTVHQVICEMIDPDGIITAGRLDLLTKQVLSVNHFNELKLAGLNEQRVDVFVPGLAILTAVFDTFGIEQMRYSDGALREGVIYSLEKNFQVENIRQRTGKSLVKQFNLDTAQSQRVLQTTLCLWSQFNDWTETDYIEEMRDILFWAALLHEVGLVINHKSMEKHSTYILQHIELPGFTKNQQQLLAILARYQQKSLKLSEISHHLPYPKADIIALIRLLRIAIIFNKSRQATEQTDKISLKTDRTLWQLTFEPHYLAKNPLIAQELATEKELLSKVDLSLSFS